MALTVGASIIWGTSFFAVSVGLQYSNPYALLFERFFVASIAVLAAGIFIKSARIWPELSKARTWILGGVDAVSFLLQFLGQEISGASASALLSNLFILFVPVAAYFILNERMPNASKGAIAISIPGIVLVFPSALQVSNNTLGDLLLLGASVGYTLFIVLGKKFNASSLASSSAIIVSITVIMAPVAVIAGGPFLPVGLAAPIALESVFWLGIPCTAIALAMYTRGLGSIRATQSAMLLLFEIIVGVALSVSLLGNSLSQYQVIGALIIALAIALSSRR